MWTGAGAAGGGVAPCSSAVNHAAKPADGGWVNSVELRRVVGFLLYRTCTGCPRHKFPWSVDSRARAQYQLLTRLLLHAHDHISLPVTEDSRTALILRALSGSDGNGRGPGALGQAVRNPST